MLREGETLKLEETAKTLRSFGKDPRWFYRGPWVEAAVRTANEHGGTLEARDFAVYAPEVGPALHGRYLGYDLYAGGLGGATLLASLGALESLRAGAAARPFSASADELELLLRIAGQARDGRVVPALAQRGLVGGVPLATAGETAFDEPGLATLAQRADPLSDTIVLKDGEPRAALAVYGTGLFPGDMQILDAVLARGLDAEQAVLEPRVGYVEFDAMRMTLDVTKRSVDPRFEEGLLCQLQERGFTLERSMPGYPAGFVDTGFPTLVTMALGRLHGITPDAPYIHGLAAGD